MATLYDIAIELLDLTIAIAEAEEAKGADSETAQKRVDEIVAAHFATEENFDEKVDNYAALIQEFNARADARKAEAKRLSERAAVDANNAKGLKERLQHVFERLAIKTRETRRFRVTLAKHGGKVPLSVDDQFKLHPENAPEEYQKHRVDIDNEAVRGALEAGTTLPWARLGERGQSIRIK